MTADLGGVDSSRRKDAVTKYFTPTPDIGDLDRAARLLWSSGAVAVVAVCLLLTGLFAAAACAAVVAAIALQQGLEQRAGYQRRFRKAEPKPTDAAMEVLFRDDLGRAAERGLWRLGLTKDELELRTDDVDPLSLDAVQRPADQPRSPLSVFGPTERARGRFGREDGVLRFTHYQIMIICPTGHHLGIYECVLDMPTGRLRDEETREYHYDDVVAVSTRTTSTQATALEIVDRSGFHERVLGRTLNRMFEVIVSSGHSSEIVVGMKDEEEPQDRYRLQESGIDHVIRAVRRMLREKKGGTVPPL